MSLLYFASIWKSEHSTWKPCEAIISFHHMEHGYKDTDIRFDIMYHYQLGPIAATCSHFVQVVSSILHSSCPHKLQGSESFGSELFFKSHLLFDKCYHPWLLIILQQQSNKKQQGYDEHSDTKQAVDQSRESIYKPVQIQTNAPAGKKDSLFITWWWKIRISTWKMKY